MKFSPTIRRPFLLAILTAVSGLILSFYAHSRIAGTEADAARMTSETLQLNTEQELNLFADVLQSVCALHALSDAVDQAAMNEFLEKGMVYQRTVLGPFGLTQRIGPQIRAAMEQLADETPGTGYRVLKKGPAEGWVPVESKPVYYPLTWQSQANGLNIPVGFDFSSLGEETRQTIRRLEQSRRPVLVPAPVDNQAPEIKGQESAARQAAYWVFAPVIPGRIQPDTSYTSGSVIGFSVAILHPDAILQRITKMAGPSAGLTLRLTLAENSNSTETVRLANGRWNCSRPLEAIGTHWIFDCSFPTAVTGRRSALALAAGLIITALLTAQLLVLAGQTRKIEAEVRARTNDLRIANVRLEETLRERARLEEEMHELSAREQRRIGRDLHDSLGQKLTGAVFLSRSLLNWFQNAENSPDTRHPSPDTRHPSPDTRHPSPDTRHPTPDTRHPSPDTRHPTPDTCPAPLATQTAHAKTLNETLKDAVAQVRNLARGLASVTLNEESLEESIDQMAEEMSALYSTQCKVERSGTLPNLERKTKEQLYFIAREAVNNAARHAKPQHITIHLTGDGNSWSLRVEDNGAGFHGGSQAPRPDAEGMGLRIMRHRASRIGAQLAITSEPGQGTVITVTGTV